MRAAGHTGTPAGLAALAGLRLVRPHAITGVICPPGGVAGLGEDRRPAAAVQRAEGVNPVTWSSTAKGLLVRPFSMKNAVARTDGQGEDASVSSR